MSSPTRVGPAITLEEFLRLPDVEPPWLEYLDGRVIAKVSPQKKHRLIQAELVAALNRFARPAGLGLAFVELRCTYAGRSIVPDVVFLSRAHIELDAAGEIVNETRVPPDLHVEVVSPDQSPRPAAERLIHALEHGAALGWRIDPERKAVDVYRPGQPPERLGADGVLEGDPVLPGFRLGVAELFGWLRPGW